MSNFHRSACQCSTLAVCFFYIILLILTTIKVNISLQAVQRQSVCHWNVAFSPVTAMLSIEDTQQAVFERVVVISEGFIPGLYVMINC